MRLASTGDEAQKKRVFANRKHRCSKPAFTAERAAIVRRRRSSPTRNVGAVLFLAGRGLRPSVSKYLRRRSLSQAILSLVHHGLTQNISIGGENGDHGGLL